MNKPQLILLRIIARLIDLLLLYLGFGVFYNWINRENLMDYDMLFRGFREMVFYLPFCIVYVPVFETITQGFTIGKFICRIKVNKIDGSQIGIREAFLRWSGSILDFALTAGLGALISAIRSNKVQRIGDRLAKTVVNKV